jgi:lycopene cyclase domain-containing protein
MDFKNFTYLLLNVLSVSVPLACSFEHQIQFWKKWKYYLPALLLTAFIFLVWDYFKTKHGVWSFNSQYVLGIYWWGMPMEEYLFFITIPYACTFIYETIEKFVEKPLLLRHADQALMGLSIIAAVLSFFFIDKIYTWSVLFGVFIIIPFLLHFVRGMKLQSFLLMYFIALIPMFVVNGFLTGLPVVVYNNQENLNIRLGSIPIEDFAYNLILMSMNIGLFEWLRSRSYKTMSNGELPLVQLF